MKQERTMILILRAVTLLIPLLSPQRLKTPIAKNEALDIIALL